MPTPKADALLESLEEDKNGNLMVSFILQDNVHQIRLNERLTSRKRNLQKVKDELVEMKYQIIGCMIDNINDQNKDDSLVALMSMFDLSEEGLESRTDKLGELYDIYGVDNVHSVPEKWFDYEIRGMA